MSDKNYKSNLRISFNKKFIQKIFNDLSDYFVNSTNASKIIKLPRPTFFAYKNGYISSLPKKLVIEILKLKLVSTTDIKKNKILEYNQNEKNKQILFRGRMLRNNQLKKWKSEIPPLNKIFINNSLNFEEWFTYYQKLINFGAREFNYILSEEDLIKMSYTTHSNKNKKEFVLKFPKKIKVDNDFLYFFGLWVGDKAGGKRFGIMNTNKEIIYFTQHYLKKLYQIPEIVLYIAENQDLPEENFFNKIVRIKNKQKGYAFSVHVINGILTSFFNYLEKNLEEFLFSIENPNIFFAGLFDAEGNIFLEDSCFRWACKNSILKEIFEIHLKRLNLFKRYDGSNFVTYNKQQFEKLILPFLIHPQKINNTNLVCFNKGYLDDRFKNILEIIHKNPGITNTELAKALKKKKVYAQVRVLERLGYIFSKNYPKQMFINKPLGEN